MAKRISSHGGVARLEMEIGRFENHSLIVGWRQHVEPKEREKKGGMSPELDTALNHTQVEKDIRVVI